MKKILAILCIISMLIIGSLFCAAEEFDATTPPSKEPAVEDNSTEVSEGGEIKENVFKQWLSEWQAAYEADQATAEEPSSFAEWVWYKVLEHKEMILSICAFLATLIGIFYNKIKIRKPLLSFANKTSSNLTSFTNAVSQNVEKANDNAQKALNIAEGYDKAYNDLLEEHKKLSAELEKLSRDRKALSETMKLQSTMLNTVIQASTITQWRKDQIGELHTKALKKISDLESSLDGDKS